MSLINFLKSRIFFKHLFLAVGIAFASVILIILSLRFYTHHGQAFSVPHLAFFDRSKRYALYAEDGVVKVLNQGEESNACEISGGEAMVAAI